VIAKVQPSKRKSRSSFKRLLNYLTMERDPETGKTLLRGDVVMSHNLVGIDTAAAEMKGVESLNPRCNDAVFHYELAWPPGERPSRAEWVDSALYTLNQLGFKEHQYVLVAHDDKKHFHIHVMVNRFIPKHTKPILRTEIGSLLMAQYAILKPSMAGPTRLVQCDGTRIGKWPCRHRKQNAMRHGLLNNTQLAPPQSTSIITMKSPSRPMCVEKLLRMYERC
jgi:hypothetical protein